MGVKYLAEGIGGTDIGSVDAEEGEDDDPDGAGGGDNSNAEEGVGDFGPSRFDFRLVATGSQPLDATEEEIDQKKNTGTDDGGVDHAKDQLGNTLEIEEIGDFGADVDGGLG